MSFSFYTDFDGTITEHDTLVLLLDRFGKRLPDGRDWRSIEFDPALLERIKLQAELDLLTCSFDEGLKFLKENVQIRQGFSSLANVLHQKGIPVHVLSGGLLPILRQTLAPLELPNLLLAANDLRFEGDRWCAVPPTTPHINNECNHCKSWHLMKKPSTTRIYVGDGSTDFCPAAHADLVFARGSLLKHCRENNLPHEAFTSFDDIHHSLIKRGLLPEVPPQHTSHAIQTCQEEPS